MNIIVLLLIGLAAGYLAGIIWKGHGFGLIGNLIVGIAGSFIGGFLLKFIGFSIHGLVAEIVSAIIGAIILLWIINKIR